MYAALPIALVYLITGAFVTPLVIGITPGPVDVPVVAAIRGTELSGVRACAHVVRLVWDIGWVGKGKGGVDW